MYVKLDYLSFSLTWHARVGQDDLNPAEHILFELNQLDPRLADILDIGAHWEDTNGRRPYEASFTHPETRIRVFYHRSLTHALFEISGQGCDALYERGYLFLLLRLVAQRLTRLDIACDMETDTNPLDFVTQREAKRFKSSSHVQEESGTTWYVGSRSSNRFARVYRYNEPHPRAHLLRAEYELHQEDAKLTGQTILEQGLEAVAVALGEQFGWKHAAWNTEGMTAAPMPAYRAERGQGKTLFWLNDTVAPLLLRLHQEGVIDVQAWFDENIVGKMDAAQLASIERIPF